MDSTVGFVCIGATETSVRVNPPTKDTYVIEVAIYLGSTPPLTLTNHSSGSRLQKPIKVMQPLINTDPLTD